MDLGAGQAADIDDAGMVQVITDDMVFGTENGRDGSGVGGEAGLENHAGFHVLESRDALLQLHVYAHGAGDGANRAAPDTERSEEHTSELQSHLNLVCRLLLEKKKKNKIDDV